MLDDPILDAGDRFFLHMTLGNSTSTRIELDAYILLDVYGNFWSWPDWIPIAQGLGNKSYDLEALESAEETVLEFNWPSGTGSASGLYFYGASFTRGTFDLFGTVQAILWEYR